MAAPAAAPALSTDAHPALQATPGAPAIFMGAGTAQWGLVIFMDVPITVNAPSEAAHDL